MPTLTHCAQGVSANANSYDVFYFIIVGLTARDSAAWEEALLAEYHSELCKRRAAAGEPRASIEDYSLAQLTGEYRLVGLVFLVIQVCVVVAGLGKKWGSNRRNFLPWSARLLKYTMRMDVVEVVELVAPDGGAEAAEITELLEDMREQAATRYGTLVAEHGAEVVEAL